jgi:hypothetical protein
MYELEKALDYANAVERVKQGQRAITQSDVYSFEYDMDGDQVNILVVCDGFEAETLACDLGLRLLGKVATAKLAPLNAKVSGERSESAGLPG